jgi:hypothetical protein
LFEEQPGSNTDERVLYSSTVVPTLSKDCNDCDDAAVSSAGEEIVKLVVMYVLKACLTLADMLDRNRSKNMIVVRPKMPCRVLNQNEHVFAFGTVTLKKLELQNFKAANLKELYVIHHIASGDYGSCYLCVTATGASCCAVKFFHRLEFIDTAAQAELKTGMLCMGRKRASPVKLGRLRDQSASSCRT